MIRNPPQWTLWLALMIIMPVTNSVFGQSRSRQPHLAYLFPAGCERGMTCEVVVGGQHLKEANEVYISGEGVEVEIVNWYRPLTAGEYNNLRTKLRESGERLVGQAASRGGSDLPTEAEIALAAGVSEVQMREMKVYRERQRDPKRQPNEQLEEEVTLRITVAMEAKLGKRELHLLTDTSISNPIWLHLNRWIEQRESEPNHLVPSEVESRLPVVINGQIMPGDVDRFRFRATKGMQLVIQVAARDVIPYLADAVPGWFQAVIRIIDESGDEVSFADSFYYRQDPVLYFDVPRDGRYTIEIRDSLFRGREDFVYRMTIGEIPFVTSVFPLGARVDSDLKVQLRGWNLTRTEQNVRTMPRSQYRPVAWYSAIQGDHSVRFPLQIDHWPEVFEQASNDDQMNAQEISTRMTVNGRIDRPGDQDVYVIKGGGRFVADIQARRLGSPLDSMLTLTDALGNEIAFNDDYVDKSQTMLTHHADSHLSASLAPDRDHFLTVADAQNKGGPEYGYRLCLRAPQADYELRVVPSRIVGRAGQVVPITVVALRRDGFDSDIECSLVDAPPGFRIDGGVIPGEANEARMTLTLPNQPTHEVATLAMEGRAGRRLRSRSSIVRPAIPAENMMQAFIWHHLVPVENWKVVVSGGSVAKMPLQVVMPDKRVLFPREGKFRLNVIPVSKKAPLHQLRVELSEPTSGISASIVSDPMTSTAIEFDVSSDTFDAGFRGNLIVSVYKESTPAPTEENPAPRTRRTEYGFLPAIPFEISSRSSSPR